MARRLRPSSVCPRCEGFMQRKTAIRERTGARYWGDIDPYLNLGAVDIQHFICVVCGNISAYQLKGGEK
jgi:hypothetical protein